MVSIEQKLVLTGFIDNDVLSANEAWEVHKAKIDELGSMQMTDEQKEKLEAAQERARQIQMRVDRVQKVYQRYKSLNKDTDEEVKLEEADKVKMIIEAIEKSEEAWAKIRAEEGTDVRPSEYEKETAIEEYRDKMVARQRELEEEFAEKARKRREQTVQLQEEIKDVTATLMEKVNKGNLDDALTFIKSNLVKEDPSGRLPGTIEDYLTDNALDVDKVQDKLDMIKEAVDERLEEIDEFMVNGWEEQIVDMLDAPFLEMDSLIVQYCYGDKSIRRPYQILEECEQYWEGKFQWRKKKLGEIERVDPEKSEEEQKAARERIVQQVNQLKEDLLGDEWEKLQKKQYVREDEEEEREKREKEDI